MYVSLYLLPPEVLGWLADHLAPPKRKVGRAHTRQGRQSHPGRRAQSRLARSQAAHRGRAGQDLAGTQAHRRSARPGADPGRAVQAVAHPRQPAAGRVRRQAVHRARHLVPRLDPGRQHRPACARWKSSTTPRATSSARMPPGGFARPSRAPSPIRRAPFASRSTWSRRSTGWLRIQRDLTQELGREPTSEEIAVEMELLEPQETRGGPSRPGRRTSRSIRRSTASCAAPPPKSGASCASARSR